MEFLPAELDFIQKGQTWAIVGDSSSGPSALLERITGEAVELVSFRHHFKNLSNTTDFYYQQRFNSSDSEDSQTVKEYLLAVQTSGYWNSGNVIKYFHLQPLLDEQVIKLSNGETKKLLIASALVKNPDVLVLDHPLTGLDSGTRNEFSKLLKHIAESGILIIIATDPWEIPETVTHIAVMYDQKVCNSMERTSFNPGDFNFVHPTPLPLNELKELITHHQNKNFNIILEMKNVTVEYDGRKILNDINWTVKQGEKWSLSGPNGAGKSTLLSLANGDNPQAYANNIILFDRKRGTGESIWDIKRQTGFVSPELFQYFPMDSFCMHVIESGFYDTVGLFRPADPEKESICMRWMNILHLGQYSNTLFSRVPSDVQRLCLLARALVKNPALLILDEPTQGLDTSRQQFFIKLIDNICSISNVTLIYVSHYVQHIPSAVTMHLRLENGKVVD
jgi:molybdate transport system ATP-binding protein